LALAACVALGVAGCTGAPTAAPTTAPAPHTIAAFSGSGIKTTTVFTVPDEWVINWTFDCSKLPTGGQPLNFQIYEYRADGTLVTVLANVLSTGGPGTNNQHVDGGSRYLTINSECAWTVTVVG
jgi:hypothetical protein